jgi:hypothetical protein
VVTVTVGSSILGYSRSDRLLKLTAPISKISKDSTTGELVIKPKDLTVTGAKDTSKVYNATTQTNSDAKVSGLQGDDRVTVTGYAAARNVGDGVKSDALKLELVNPGDYNVSYTNGSLAITPYRLSATGGSSTAPGLTSSASDKIYDGNTTASGTVAPVLFAGDSLTASASSASFDTKNVGSGKTVTFSGLSLGGNATTLANYSLPASSTATAEVKKRPLSITGATTTQAYNAATQSNAAAKVEAMVSGESVTVSGYGQGRNPGNYADALVAAAGAGTSLSNYAVSYTNGALTITPASRKPDDPAPLVLPLTAASAAAVASGGSPIVSVLVVQQTSNEIGGIVVVYVPKELATSGQGFAFRFPDSLYPSPVDGAQADTNRAATRATLTNGDPLPRWLSFDPVTKVISASAVPDRSFPIEVLITDGEKVITVVVSERAAGN